MAIEVIGEIVPKNNGKFAIIRAEHILCNGGRLSEFLPVKLTQEEYDALVASGQMNPNTPYCIKESSG